MKFSRGQLAVLGLLLAVAEILQRLLVNSTANVHTAIAVAIVTLGALGATTAAASVIGATLPHQVAVILTIVANVLQAVNTGIDTTDTVHAIIGAVLVLLVTIGIKSDVPLPTTGSATKEARRLAPGGSPALRR